MSGGDATSRGHLNADDGVDGRDRTGPDIQAAGAGAEPPGGDTREQGEASAPSPIGGSTEADAVEIGGNEPDYLVRIAPHYMAVYRDWVSLDGLSMKIVPTGPGTADIYLRRERGW
jgi:hypothetical protein